MTDRSVIAVSPEPTSARRGRPVGGIIKGGIAAAAAGAADEEVWYA
jgi:hypothetical protein